MKGFEIYKKFDELLEKKEFSDLFTLTYIGNIPKNFTFKNIEVLPISSLMGEAIKRISNSTSVSDLFK